MLIIPGHLRLPFVIFKIEIEWNPVFTPGQQLEIYLIAEVMRTLIFVQILKTVLYLSALREGQGINNKTNTSIKSSF